MQRNLRFSEFFGRLRYSDKRGPIGTVWHGYWHNEKDYRVPFIVMSL